MIHGMPFICIYLLDLSVLLNENSLSTVFVSLTYDRKCNACITMSIKINDLITLMHKNSVL